MIGVSLSTGSGLPWARKVCKTAVKLPRPYGWPESQTRSSMGSVRLSASGWLLTALVDRTLLRKFLHQKVLKWIWALLWKFHATWIFTYKLIVHSALTLKRNTSSKGRPDGIPSNIPFKSEDLRNYERRWCM